MLRVNLMIVAITLAWGCGSTAAQRPVSAPSVHGRASAQAPAPASATPVVPVTRGEIDRGDLTAVLDAGLGRFLQGVGTEAHLESGRFVGFRLTRLYPDDERFARVDLRPGDTVVRVNGRPIERPEQAMRVWQELRVASELMIEYVRGGERRELRFTIEDQ